MWLHSVIIHIMKWFGFTSETYNQRCAINCITLSFNVSFLSNNTLLQLDILTFPNCPHCIPISCVTPIWTITLHNYVLMNSSNSLYDDVIEILLWLYMCIYVYCWPTPSTHTRAKHIHSYIHTQTHTHIFFNVLFTSKYKCPKCHSD